MEFNVKIAGVGGQGVITLGRMLSEAGIYAGHNVVMSEIHGLAQRGGSVSVNVRFGELISPIPESGSIDVVLGLEPLEALRNLGQVKDGILYIIGLEKMVPVTLSVKGMEYPEIGKILSEISSRNTLIPVDPDIFITTASDRKMINSVVAGVFCGSDIFDIQKEDFQLAIKTMFPEKCIVRNIEYFEKGFDFAREYMKKYDIVVD